MSIHAENRIRVNTEVEQLNLDVLALISLDPLLPLLAEMPNLRALSVARNKLTSLPEDLSALSHLEYLNLSGNPITSVEQVIAGLCSLPSLRSLDIDLPLGQEEEVLVTLLPELLQLNHIFLTDNYREDLMQERTRRNGHEVSHLKCSTERDIYSTYWTVDDTREAERLFAYITEAAPDYTHSQEFSDYLRSVVKDVECLTAMENDPLLQEGEVLNARRLVFEYCFKQILKSATKEGSAFDQRMIALLECIFNLMGHYDKHWRHLFRDRDVCISLMVSGVKDALQQTHHLMDHSKRFTNHNNERGAHGMQLSSTRGTLSQSRGNTCEQEVLLHDLDSSLLPRCTIPRLTLETSGIRQEKGTAMAALNDSLPTPSPSTALNLDLHHSKSSYDDSDPYCGKTLTLRQLKDTIEEIYSSKIRYDAKCPEEGLPHETMAHHIHTYLSQRCALKESISGWTTAITQGVCRYNVEDDDVAVFGKILRNDIDEQFQCIQEQIREAVRRLIRMQIKNKRPSVGSEGLDLLLQAKMNGFLEEKEWVYVITNMYNTQDAAAITEVVNQAIHRQTCRDLGPSQHQRRTDFESELRRMGYKDLISILLRFQLGQRERFLSLYTKTFRLYDTDRDGIVKGDEFMSIVRALDPSKTDEMVLAMLKAIDPLEINHITYSEIVKFLINEIVKQSQRE